MDVRVGINPDYVQIAVLLEGGKHRGACNGVVTSDQKWQMEILADSVQLLVAVLGAKLFVAHYKGLGFTNFFEDIVVHVEGTLVDTRSFLALAAHAENRFEF